MAALIVKTDPTRFSNHAKGSDLAFYLWGYMTKTINIKGKSAIVDEIDLANLVKYKWSIKLSKNTAYLRTYIHGKTVYMHQMVIGGTPLGYVIDHINGNGLDNRRCNLRIASPAQNQWNVKKQSVSCRAFKGIIKRTDKARGKPFYARIRVNGMTYRSPSFATEKEASNAYLLLSNKYHKEFSNMQNENIVKDGDK